MHTFSQFDVAQGDWRMVEGDSPLSAQWELPPVRFCSSAECSLACLNVAVILPVEVCVGSTFHPVPAEAPRFPRVTYSDSDWVLLPKLSVILVFVSTKPPGWIS